MFGCEKEQKQENTISSNIPTKEVSVDNYDDYIDSLIAETGIDIYGLSELSDISTIADYINTIADNAYDNVGNMSLINVDSLDYYINKMEYYYNLSNYSMTLVYFDSLCSIFDNQYGDILSLDYEEYLIPRDDIYTYLPISDMHEVSNKISDCMSAIQRENINFSRLSYEKQIDVLNATIYIYILRNQDRFFSVEDCEKKAKNKLIINLTVATTLYTAGAALCAGTFVAALACEAVAYAGYMSAVAVATDLYNSEILLCQQQQ